MTDQDAVAVIGMSGRFPGAPDLDAYWSDLRAGRCRIAALDEAELLADGADPAELARPDYVRAKGVLDDADRFEAELFGVNRADAKLLDPQARVLLETAWSALEHAGIDPTYAPADTGVYVGGSATEHALAAQADPRVANEAGAMRVRTLTGAEFLAAWLSYRLGLQGPSLTVQAACASSLAAVHLATQALLLGECDTALAGGVSIDSVRRRGYRFHEGGILAPDGRCRPFDEGAAGTVPGNGAGLVVLRRLDDALADGDPVLAVIRGTALTNDGAAKAGFTAPGVDRQVAAITEAWSAAGLEPTDAQYIEAHGTGTRVGDRIELAAITTSMREAASSPATRCGIGSVKAAIGHLDAAAGIAGLLKTVLMLRHRTLVPTIGVTTPLPELAAEDSPLYLVACAEPWRAPAGTPRRAGVSSIGIGGTNVHVVLEEAPARAEDMSERLTDGASVLFEVLPISARTDAQLAEAARRLGNVLRAADAPRLRDVGHTLRTARASLARRAYVLASDLDEAVLALDALAAGRAEPAQRATERDEPSVRLIAAAERWVTGDEVTWPAVADDARCVPLPTYPFDGERRGALWLDPRAPAGAIPIPSADNWPELSASARTGLDAGNAGAGVGADADTDAGADAEAVAVQADAKGAPPAGEELERAVAELLMETLGLEDVAELDKSFFEAGGDSLAAVHVVGRIQDDYGVDVPIELVLEPLSLREFATRVRTTATQAATGADVLSSLLDEL